MSMLSTELTSLLSRYVGEIARVGVAGWTVMAVYVEVAESSADKDPETGDTLACWVGDRVTYEVFSSLEAEDAVTAFHRACAQQGSPWKAMSLRVNCDGSYRVRYFYEGTPLLDGDIPNVQARLDAATDNSIVSE